MAASVTINHRLGGVGGGKQINLVTVTMDSSYATSGEAITAADCGLGRIDDLFPIGSTGGWDVSWDQTNSKVFAFGGLPGTMLAITKAVTFATMTDNTDPTGYIDFATSALPIGAIPLASQFNCTTAFSGDTTAVWKMGISGDLDRYSALTTNSCFTAIKTSALVKNATAVQGTDAARTPRLTITGGSDFGLLNASGAGTATLWYMLPTASQTPTAESEAASTTDLSLVTFRAMVIGLP